MNWINGLLIGIQVTCAVTMIFLILLQHGKGADMGAAFGGGASGSLFGASGSANFLSRTTAVLAAVFFLTTIGMAYTATVARTSSARADHAGVMSNVGKDAPAPATAPSGAPSEIPATAAPASTTPPAAPATGNSTPAKPSDIPK